MSRSRTLTVLVADVVRSTELFGRLGVDRADDARRALFAVFASAVEVGNGELVKTMGDGCLAAFDSAAEAVSSAVALQQATARLRERTVPGLGLRVGVAVGDVTEEDGDVFGPAVVTASRLCGAAGEHQVLASDLVRLLAGDRGGHTYEAVGELVLKGIADPVAACAIRVDAAANGRHPLPAALAATPGEVLVGRDSEQETLLAAAEEAGAGERRAVVVAGEPGAGKTRLVAAAARRAHDEGALVLFGRCEEDLAVAYQPVAQALRGGLAGLDAITVAAHVADHGGELRRLVPTLEAPEPVAAEPALEQARLFDAVTDLLRRASEDRLVILVLDDLHWATPSTVALVRHLLGADPDQRLCVLGTYRDTEVDRTHALGGLLADMARTRGAQRLTLRGLNGEDIADLLAAASAHTLDDDGRALAVALAERTDGNPFFATQMLGHLVERGVIVQEGGRWTISAPLGDIDLPAGVLDVVGRRLARLSPAANQVLAVAAVAGLEFGVRVLSEVPDAGGPDAVVDGVDEAVRARLLVETGPGRTVFTHAIVRDALTSELSAAKQAQLHRALGQAIVALYGEGADVPLADLAHHFTEAAILGDTATAARWATAAATAAADEADQRGAIAVLERALAVIETVEPVDQTARFEVAVAAAERHCTLKEFDSAAVGSAADAARRMRSGARMLRIAIAHHRQLDQGTELFEEALQLLDPEAVPLRALAIAVRARRRSLQADPAFIEDVAVAAELLPQITPIAPRVAAAVRMYIVSAGCGLPGAGLRLELCDEALAVAPHAEDPWWDELVTGIDVTGVLQLFRGRELIGLGRRAEFEVNRLLLRDLGERSGETGYLTVAEEAVALLALLDGRFDDATASADRMIAGAPAEDNTRLAYFSLIGRIAIEQGRSVELLPFLDAALAISPELAAVHAAAGHVRVEAGDHAAAAKALDHLTARWTAWARDWTWPSTLTATAETVVGLGAADQAETIVDELEPYAGELAIAGVGILTFGAFDRYRGMLLTLLERHDDASAALDAALALEEAVEAPALAARTRYWLARALLARHGPGDPERSATELDSSIRTADRLGMGALATAGRNLLAGR